MWFRHPILAIGLFFAGQYFQFDIFSSVMLAMTGFFLSLFAATLSRYQRRIGVGKAGERAVQNILSSLGVEAVHDVYLQTPDGSMQLDHIALFPGSLAVIETKTYNGRFDLLDGKNYWYRLGHRGKRSINNPLWQLEAAKKALSDALPGTRVWGLVVLAGKYTATNNHHPKNVVSIRGLRNYIVDHRRRHGEWRYGEHIMDAWTRLKALKTEHAPLGKNHVIEARKKRGERFYFLEDAWPLWLWGSLATEAGVLCFLAHYDII
jgi:hypothetical protein